MVVVMGIAIGAMLILCIIATVYAAKYGRVSGDNRVLNADAARHATDLKRIVDANKATLARYKKALASRKEDLDIARDDIGKMHVAIAEGKNDEALKIGGNLRDLLTAPDDDDELLEVPVVEASDEGGNADNHDPS